MPTMFASELLKEIDEFRDKLIAHRETLTKANNSFTASLVKPSEIDSQTSILTRLLGKLRRFIEKFDDQWIMQIPSSGVKWDILATAVSRSEIGQKKFPSLDHAIDKLNVIAGQLEALPSDLIISTDSRNERTEIADRYTGYLPHLHPIIAQASAKLFTDGHYTAAIDQSAKAVFQHLRDISNIDLDGAALAQQVFRPKDPVLVFSDLADETKMNEQVGFMNMLEAYYKGVRNPLAHTFGKTKDAQTAFEYIVLASLLCRKIDDANPPG